jgi:hypothetical protein
MDEQKMNRLASIGGRCLRAAACGAAAAVFASAQPQSFPAKPVGIDHDSWLVAGGW